VVRNGLEDVDVGLEEQVCLELVGDLSDIVDETLKTVVSVVQKELQHEHLSDDDQHQPVPLDDADVDHPDQQVAAVASEGHHLADALELAQPRIVVFAVTAVDSCTLCAVDRIDQH